MVDEHPELTKEVRAASRHLRHGLSEIDDAFQADKMTLEEAIDSEREVFRVYLQGVARLVCRQLVRQAVDRSLHEDPR